MLSLNALSNEGHCYARREMLTEKGKELLEVEEHLLVMTLDEMIRAEDVIREDVGTLASSSKVAQSRDGLPRTEFGGREETIYLHSSSPNVGPQNVSPPSKIIPKESRWIQRDWLSGSPSKRE